MILAFGLLAVGFLAPYALRELSQHMSPRLVIAANLAGLMLAWLGIIDLVSVWVMPEHGLLGLCRTAFFKPQELDDVHGGWVLLPTAVALGGRALRAVFKTWRGMSLARGQLMGSELPTAGGLMFAKLGTVACTVGFLRPRIVVDEALLGVLTPRQQRAVIAHERCHARGWHALIDLGARALAAGLAPWPGARVGYREIRRHLEAVADDWAAGRTSRRDVATAIVEAAAPPPAPMLGAAGWAVWRVDRLLSPRPRRLWHAITALALVGVALAVVVQLSTHAMAGVHFLPPDLPCCQA